MFRGLRPELEAQPAVTEEFAGLRREIVLVQDIEFRTRSVQVYRFLQPLM